jgi:cytoskeleton protein RodZ
MTSTRSSRHCRESSDHDITGITDIESLARVGPMSAVEKAPEVAETGHDLDHDAGQESGHDESTLRDPVQVEVRRNAVVSALLGAAASAIAIAYLWRAAETGHVIDWVLCGALGALGAVFLHSLLDARTPLLVADELGVRIRLGTTWRGLPWEGIERVVVRPRRGHFRDGSLVVQMSNVARTIEGLEGRARRHARLNRKAYGGALAVPLGLATRHEGSDDELSDRIALLSQGRAEVVTLIQPAKAEPEPEVSEVADQTASPVEDGQARADALPFEEDRQTDEAAAAGAATVATASTAATEGTEVAQEEQDQHEQPARVRRRWLRRQRAQTDETAEAEDAHPESDAESDAEAEPDAESDAEAEPDAEAEAESVTEPVSEIGPERPDRAVAELPVQREDSRPADQPVGRSADQPVELPSEPRAIPLRIADEGVTVRIDDVPTRGTRTADAVNSMREAVNPVGRNDSRVRAIAKLGDPVAPLVIDDYQPEPAYDPAIGPELAASRTRVGLSVDELADRTRIRPHVIESIEVDDFTPCGGDFYARGHIRTLSRVLGKDPVPLLAIYEARYAHAPVNARKVFEAELATGMGGQMTRPYGGPNWTGLVAAVLVLVLVWAGVRLFAGDGGEVLEEPPPVLDGSAGLSSYYGDPEAPGGPQPVTTVLTAVDDGASVEVRGGDDALAFDGVLVLGEVKRVRAIPPVTVTSDDGGAVRVRVGVQDHGLLGDADSAAKRTFEAPEQSD